MTTTPSVAEAASRLRLSRRRLAAVVLLGPLVGAVVYLLVVLLTGPAGVTVDDVTAMGGLIVFMGWILGLIPATVAAVIVHWLGLASGRPRRMVEALAIGALAALIAQPVILPVLFGIAFPPPEVVLLLGLCGAVSLCATALPGLGAR